MTHQICGVGAAAVCAAAADVPATTAAALVGAAWLGSMLPDADKAGSHVYQPSRLERRHLPLRVLGAVARLPLRLFALLPHRRITHSLFACALVGLALGLVTSWFAPGLAHAAGVGAGLGYAA